MWTSLAGIIALCLKLISSRCSLWGLDPRKGGSCMKEEQQQGLKEGRGTRERVCVREKESPAEGKGSFCQGGLPWVWVQPRNRCRTLSPWGPAQKGGLQTTHPGDSLGLAEGGGGSSEEGEALAFVKWGERSCQWWIRGWGHASPTILPNASTDGK